MFKEILLYLLGLFIVFNFLSIWFASTIKIHIGNAVRGWRERSAPAMHTEEEWENWLATWGMADQTWRDRAKQLLADLLLCPICLGVWVSLLVAVSIQQTASFSLLYILVSVVSWPALSAAAYKFVWLTPKTSVQ